MSFQALKTLLHHLEHQYHNPEATDWRSLVQQWPEIVGKRAASHSRPLGIQRGTLQVAVSSPVWSQTLMFERSRLLSRLNQQLHQPLSDMRFSTARWQETPLAGTPYEQVLLTHQHPCYVEPPASTPAPTPTLGRSPHPSLAFEHWAQLVQQRSRALSSCPRCLAPTPAGELARWTVCSLCYSQKTEPDSIT
jgi:predicted nucleic acid-binding Zn ribbon protein